MATKLIPSFVRASGHLPLPSLTEVISRGLVSRETREARLRLYASDIYCPREAVLNANASGIRVNSATATTYMSLGNAIEDVILRALSSQNSLLFSQYRLPETSLDLGGRIDAVVIVEGKLRIVEIKSINDLPVNPKLHHRSQALVYSVTCGLPASLLYFSRKVSDYTGSLLVKEFKLDTVTSEEREAVVWRAAYAHLALLEGVIPDVPYHITEEKQCEYCPFIDHCWRGVPLPGKSPSAAEHSKLVNRAAEITKTFLDSAMVQDRRNGILNHIKTYGTACAKEILSGSWAELL